MSSQPLTILTCAIPPLVGLLVFMFFRSSDGERKARTVVWWTISACSIPWLYYVWRSMLDVPGDEHVFLWTLMLSVPVWLSWEILANLGGRFVSASRAALLIAIAPLILYAIGANFSIFEQTIADYRLELIANTMLFGAFLLLGVLVRDFEIKLFQDG